MPASGVWGAFLIFFWFLETMYVKLFTTICRKCCNKICIRDAIAKCYVVTSVSVFLDGLSAPPCSTIIENLQKHIQWQIQGGLQVHHNCEWEGISPWVTLSTDLGKTSGFPLEEMAWLSNFNQQLSWCAVEVALCLLYFEMLLGANTHRQSPIEKDSEVFSQNTSEKRGPELEK